MKVSNLLKHPRAKYCILFRTLAYCKASTVNNVGTTYTNSFFLLTVLCFIVQKLLSPNIYYISPCFMSADFEVFT